MTDSRGRDATTPLEMPARGWLDILKRSWREMQKDNLSLIASGVAFYSFLAMVPLLGAVVLTYGLVANPASVMRHFQELSQMLPGEAAKLIGEQLLNVVNTAESKKGLGLILALALAFWGATKASGAIVTALNIAYEEEETRGFVKRTVINLAMVLGAVLVIGLAMIAITLLAHLGRVLPDVPGFVLLLGRFASWVLLAAIGAAAVATLYRYAPNRDAAKWRWLTPGSAFAAIGWGVLTVGFGVYVANFGNYNATYGSLGAVVVLLTWLYLSALALLLGAELNSELEHQTARDTTRGPERPLGHRNAQMADRVAPDEDGVSVEPAGRAPALARQEMAPHEPIKLSEALLLVAVALMPSRNRRPQPAD